jgi:hypothetical protein
MLGGAPLPPPVPLSATVCGLSGALSIKVIVPVAAPSAVGVNVTLIVQDALAATDVPQLFVSLNGLLACICETCNASAPVLVSVMACGELVTLSDWFPNERLEREKLTDPCPP